jgi:hypothetical protein
MNASLVWEIVGSAAGVIATVFGYLQLRQGRRHAGSLPASDWKAAHLHVKKDSTQWNEQRDERPVRHESTGDLPRQPDVGDRITPIHNLPGRNKGFTGRGALIEALREQLRDSDGAAVQVLRGMGGVGKTQLAVEYAYRFAADYDVIWWVTAEQPELIGPQVAALATELGCAPPSSDTAASVRAVMAELRARNRWLLIFDNVSDPAELRGWMPGGSAGNILITARSGGWDEISASIEIDVFNRVESAAVLQTRVPHLSADDAGKLGAALGDLPLAVAQAARYLAETGMPAGEYLDLLTTRAAEILNEGRPVSYPLSLDAATRLAFDRLKREDVAATTLLSMCAFLAPEPVPARLVSAAADHFPEPLAARVADPVALRRVLAAIGRSALARVGDNALHMHRLTQAIVRDSLTTQQCFEARTQCEAMVIAGHPGDRADPVTWPAWAQLLPHLLAVDPGSSTNAAILDLACDAAAQLWRRGDTRGTYELASKLYQQWRQRLGDDDPHTLSAAASLGDVAWDQGRYADAKELDEDVLERRRRVLGDSHPDTLVAASSLASDLRKLGRFQAAQELQQDTLARRQRLLGDDHPDTLHSARDLAATLRELRDTSAAEELDEDTLSRSKRALGTDHPGTLRSASGLASDLRRLGRFEASRELQQDAFARSRRVLGDDHPDTLQCARELAAALRELGETRGAKEIAEDTLARSRRRLGDDHPDTLQCARELAATLRELGDTRAAKKLDRIYPPP